MANRKDVEDIHVKMQDDMNRPLIQHRKINHEVSEDHNTSNNNGPLGVVLLSTLVAVLGSYEFGSCVGYSAPAQSAIREDLGLSLQEYSLFGSILNIGAMIGAITSGHIVDCLGRKGGMRVAAAFGITGWIAIYLSKSSPLLDTGRFLTGYGSGVFSYVVPIYVAEIAPKNIRGGLATLNQLMIVIGASVAFVAGTTLTWRMLALTGIIPCLLQLLGLFYIQESPRWLAQNGNEKEFENALRKLRGDETDISEEAAEIKNYIESLQHLPKARMLDLFQRRYLKSVIVGNGLMLIQQFGGANGIGFYLSETLVAAGFPSGKVGTILFAFFQIPTTTLGAFLMDKCGRRPLLIVSAIGTFLGCFLVGVSFYLKGNGVLLQWIPILVLAGVLLYTGSFSIGMGAVPWVIMSEIFPINIKGAAGSLVNLIHWSASWAVSYTYNFLFDWNAAGTYFLYSGFCAAGALFAVKLVPETKGRTLEEIQASMNS
ncbi:hypothetical protein NMG60_11034908 [Bertholletia excelsa]